MKQFEVITGSGQSRIIEAKTTRTVGNRVEFVIDDTFVASFDLTGLSIIDTEHLIFDDNSDDSDVDDIPF